MACSIIERWQASTFDELLGKGRWRVARHSQKERRIEDAMVRTKERATRMWNGDVILAHLALMTYKINEDKSKTNLPVYSS
jgi:hypothetical protein